MAYIQGVHQILCFLKILKYIPHSKPLSTVYVLLATSSLSLFPRQTARGQFSQRQIWQQSSERIHRKIHYLINTLYLNYTYFYEQQSSPYSAEGWMLKQLFVPQTRLPEPYHKCKKKMLKGQSYYFQLRLKILLRPSLQQRVYHETLMSTFSSEFRQKLIRDPVIIDSSGYF